MKGYIILLLNLIYLAGCKNDRLNIEETKVPYDVTFIKYIINEVHKISSDQYDYYITDFTIDSNGNIYIIDINNYQLKKFNNKGKLVKAVGKKGNGPGEFSRSHYSLKFIDGKIAAFNTNEVFIHLFTTDLEYFGVILNNGIVSTLDSNEDGEILISNFITGKLYTSDSTGHIKREITGIDITREKEHKLFNLVKFLEFSTGDHFYISFPFKNLVQKISLSGGPILKFKLPDIADFSKSVNGLPKEPVIQDIAVVDNGNIWILGRYSSRHPARDIYVFNNKGEYIHTFVLPEIAQKILYKNGYLYTLGKGGYEVKKWSLKEYSI